MLGVFLNKIIDLELPGCGYIEEVIGKAADFVIHLREFGPECVANLLGRLLAHIGLEEHLEAKFPGFASCSHIQRLTRFPRESVVLRLRLTISTAELAASNPLLPAFNPARSRACSR